MQDRLLHCHYLKIILLTKMLTKKVYIFGGASGIGAAAAEYFCQQQWCVIAIDKRFNTKQAITTHYTQYPCDITNRAQLEALAQELINNELEPDIIINCVGQGILGRLERIPFDKVDSIIRTNIVSTISLLQIFLPILRHSPQGRFIQMSSIAGKLTYPLSSLYHASKFAVEGLLESLQFELAKENVSVHLVRLAGIATPFSNAIQEFHDGSDAEIEALAKLKGYFSSHVNKTVSSKDVAVHLFEFANANNPPFTITIDRLGRYLLKQRNKLNDAEWNSLVTTSFNNGKL